MRQKLFALLVVMLASVVVPLAPLGAQQTATTLPGNKIAGGSDIPRDRVEIPQGGALIDVYHLMVANPSDEPISTVFRSDAPQGISVIPTRNQVKLAPKERAEVGFTVQTTNNVPGGDYDIIVSMVRDDIPDGGVPLVPAISQTVRLRVGGIAVPVTVLAIDRASKQPVTGELLLERVRANARVAVGRAQGQQLDVNVVPGDYEASFRLSGREVGRKAVRVEAGGHPVIQLEVDAISFQEVALTKIKNSGGDMTAAQLDAVLFNSLKPLIDASVRLRVKRDGKQVEDLLVQQIPTFALGTTKIGYRYIPADGWKAGNYRFELRLETGSFVVAASDVPQLSVPGGMPLWQKIGLLFLLVIVLVVIGRWWYLRRQASLAAAGYPTRAERRAAARQAREDGRQARDELKRARRRAKGQPVGPDDVAVTASSVGIVEMASGRRDGSQRRRFRSRVPVEAVLPIEPVLPPESPTEAATASAAMYAAYAAPSVPTMDARPTVARPTDAPALGSSWPTVAPPTTPLPPTGPLPPGLAPPLPVVPAAPTVDAPMPTPPANYGGVLPDLERFVAPPSNTATAVDEPELPPGAADGPLWERAERSRWGTSGPLQPPRPWRGPRAKWAEDEGT